MKKVIFGFLVITIMFSSSCTKSSSNSNNWSFKSVTYNTAACTAQSGTMQGISTNPTGGLNLSFYNSTNPAAGTYTVVSGGVANSPLQVGVILSVGTAATTYIATGGNGTQTITVSVSSGKLTAVGSGIEMVNSAASSSDSSALNLNLSQTN